MLDCNNSDRRPWGGTLLAAGQQEASAMERWDPVSLAWGITAGLWWLLYTFEEPHETGAAGFIQLVDTGICQHLREHLAYLILQDQVDAVAVQLRMAGQDLLCPCGVLLQGFGVLLGQAPGPPAYLPDRTTPASGGWEGLPDP